MNMKKLKTKNSPVLFAILAMIAFTAAPLHAAEKVDALRVAKIATDYLAKQGAGAPEIVSITLDIGTVLNVQRSWVVRWSAPLGSDAPREVGLRVKFDGSVARLVEDSKSHSTRTPVAYQIR